MENSLTVVVPDEDLAGAEARVVRWSCELGDRVSIHQPILELDTQKATVEVPAPATGILRSRLREVGDLVRSGDAVAVIEPTLENADASVAPRVVSTVVPATANRPPDRLSPGVRKVLAEHGLDAASFPRTRDGALTREEVLEYVASRAREVSAPPAARRVPHSPMRRQIAQHMTESVARAPHVTTVFQADLTAIVAHRRAESAAFAARGVKLTLTAYFIVAVARALRAVPEVNSRFHADYLEIFDDANVGIVISLDEHGLVVPVLHSVQDADLFTIASRLQCVTERARQRALRSRDVAGGTFTISNHGVSGSLFAAPIILHQGQSAALGVGKVEKRVVVEEDERGEPRMTIRDACYVTLTLDHRSLDAFHANGFLRTLTKTLEEFDVSVSNGTKPEETA
jgi:2-oxoglutarate dehydrogenase E2 component (dihydrolipoamide succinyltransferase)